MFAILTLYIYYKLCSAIFASDIYFPSADIWGIVCKQWSGKSSAICALSWKMAQWK